MTLTNRTNGLEGNRIHFSEDKCKTCYLIRNDPLYQHEEMISLNSGAAQKRVIIGCRLNMSQLCHVAAEEANTKKSGVCKM